MYILLPCSQVAGQQGQERKDTLDKKILEETNKVIVRAYIRVEYGAEGLGEDREEERGRGRGRGRRRGRVRGREMYACLD
jgi:hypothetical protein